MLYIVKILGTNYLTIQVSYI